MWDDYCSQYCWKTRRRRRRRRRRMSLMMSCCHCWCLYWHCWVTEMLETTWRPMTTIWIQGSQDGAGGGGWMTNDANMPFGYAASTGGAHAPQADMPMSGACLKLPGHTCILPVDITGFVDIFWGYCECPPKSLSNYTQIITGFGCYRDSNLDDLGHNLGRIWAYREHP